MTDIPTDIRKLADMWRSPNFKVRDGGTDLIRLHWDRWSDEDLRFLEELEEDRNSEVVIRAGKIRRELNAFRAAGKKVVAALGERHRLLLSHRIREWKDLLELLARRVDSGELEDEDLSGVIRIAMSHDMPVRLLLQVMCEWPMSAYLPLIFPLLFDDAPEVKATATLLFQRIMDKSSSVIRPKYLTGGNQCNRIMLMVYK